MKRTLQIICAMLVVFAAAGAATPPPHVNYQGVLRDMTPGNEDAPLDGTFDMVFRFFGAELGGDEILVDRHLTVNGQQVAVGGGLFNVRLGSGEILDGSGPGTYTSLTGVFRDHGDVWLEIQVELETLTPRVRIAAAPYALNASHLAGRSAQEFVDTTGIGQGKAGELVVGATSGQPETYGLEAYGPTAGGFFKDTDQSGQAMIGFGDIGLLGWGGGLGTYTGYGIQAWGGQAAGFFQQYDGLSQASLGTLFFGIAATGSSAGGYFSNYGGSGEAHVGEDNMGIDARGTLSGGYFEDIDDFSFAHVGFGNAGINARGSVQGGYFQALSPYSGVGRAGYQNLGIWGSGNQAGGYFLDADSGSFASVGVAGDGIQAFGTTRGGTFSTNGGTFVDLAGSGIGVYAEGTGGGATFSDVNDSGTAFIATGNRGVEAYGTSDGGYFKDSNNSGVAYVGTGDRGIWARGTFAGGTFSHPNGLTFWADVATPTQKIKGTGAVSFVQNHPDADDRVIVYAAPEGDEVAVYTRGTGRIEDGVARVALGETFAWTASPDVGLTAHLTPHGRSAGLHVESVTPEELVVGSDDPAAEGIVFDYLVFGLRIGFEEHAVVQPKQREAFLPTTEQIAAEYGDEPELQSFSAAARFRDMRETIGDGRPIDPEAAVALAAAINRDRERIVSEARAAAEAEHAAGRDDEPSREAARQSLAPDAEVALVSRSSEGGNGGDRITAAATPDGPGLAHTPMPVSEPVSAGDVVTLDAHRPGSVRPATLAFDPGVAGCTAEQPDGTEPPAGTVFLASSGVVLCRADAGFGEIRVGDLLTTSVNPGHAMRAVGNADGAILGKAIEPLAGGTGLIKVLVTLR